MTRKNYLVFVTALLLGVTPLCARAVLIDTLQTIQSAASVPGPVSGNMPGASSLTSPAGSLPGTRSVSSGAGNGSYFSTFAGVGTGGFFASSTFTTNADAFGSVFWQLASPVDLTDGGASQRFILNVGMPPAGVPTRLTVSVGSSQVVVQITGAGAYSVPLSSFTGNLTAVTSIGLTFRLQTTGSGSVSLTGPFQTVPEPAAALFASALTLLGLVTQRRAK